MSEQQKPELSDVKININISDQDIYGAMKQVPGYIDITTEDFREIYQLAHEHAVKRLVGSYHLRDVMDANLAVVSAQTSLEEAARVMATHRLSIVPVTDDANKIVGVLSKSDYLKCLGVKTTMELLVNYPIKLAEIERKCQGTQVESIMSSPPVTIHEDADLLSMIHILKAHACRYIPVVDSSRRVVGIVARKNFVHVCKLKVIA
jgi:CBS-domain-containing membrane protein